MQNDWYRNFFHGVALDMWRGAVTPQMTDSDAGFLAEVLESARGGRVLDIACGNGRHSIALAKRGFTVTGIDLSEEFIAEARETAAASRLDAAFHLGDMRELPLGFDGAFCFGNSFGYLDHAGTIAFVNAVAGALKPHGRFVLETGAAAESILPKLQERSWVDVGDILFLSARRYDVSASRLDMEYTFVRNGVREMRPASTHVYTVAEMLRLFENAGLTVIAMYGGVDKGPYQLGSPRLILVVGKP